MTKGAQARLMAWRLRVLQQAAGGQNVARVCRRFGAHEGRVIERVLVIGTLLQLPASDRHQLAGF
jgi:hypothetical protein